MAQKLKQSSLFFGQAAKEQEPPKPTLSGFYRGVGEAQTGAVQDIGQKVQEQTATLPGQFGVSYSPEGKAAFTEDSKFRPTVKFGSTTGIAAKDEAVKTASAKTLAAKSALDAATPETKDVLQKAYDEAAAAEEKAKDLGLGTTAETAKKVAETTGKELGTLKEEQSQAEKDAAEAINNALKAAGEKSTEAQQKVTEKLLGERRAPSELEKAAQDYRNVLQTSPGTSNVAAVANLMKFYDPKYMTLESSLRQGETALARQQAGTIKSQLGQAESQRGTSIEDYTKQAEQSYKDVQGLINQEKEKYLGTGAKPGAIGKYYGEKIEAGEAAKTAAEEAAKTRTTAEKEEADKKAAEKFGSIDSAAKGIQNVVSGLSGRASDNWLGNRGSQVIGPIAAEMTRTSEEARTIANSINLTNDEKRSKLEKLENDMNVYKTQAAGELAAFLGDPGTEPGDALDAADNILSAGLIDNLNEDQKRIIRERIEKDMHVGGKDWVSQSVEGVSKLGRIYKAFGGTKDITTPARQGVKQKAFNVRSFINV